MADITLCVGTGCSVRAKCYRAIAKASDRQSYFDSPPGTDSRCDYYLPTSMAAGGGEAYARSSDLDTSHDAAEGMVSSGKASAQAIRVYEALCAEGPRNSRELSELTGIDYASLTPRIKPLRDRKLVVYHTDADGKLVRKNKQQVWEARPPEQGEADDA